MTCLERRTLTSQTQHIEPLAARDPANAEWQRDLSVSLNKIGDVRVAEGDLDGGAEGLPARPRDPQKLAAQDPGNAVWQRDLSVSLERIGEVRARRAIGRRAGGLRAGAPSARSSPRRTPATPAGSATSRSASNKIGDVRGAEGDRAGRSRPTRTASPSDEKLAAQDPGNAGWQRDLIVSHWKLADLAEQRREEAEARRQWQAALEIAKDLDAGGRLAPTDAYFIGTIEARLSALTTTGSTGRVVSDPAR